MPFGLNGFEVVMILIAAVVAVVVISTRVKKVDDKLKEWLPDAGDRALLELQSFVPTNPELRDRARAVLDAADAKFEAEAKAYLEKRGWSVTKPGT